MSFSDSPKFLATLRHPLYWLSVWLLLAAVIGISGFYVGTQTVIPGPTTIETLRKIPGEVQAYKKDIPPRDLLLVLLSHPTLQPDDAEFQIARDKLFEWARDLKYKNGQVIFSRVETVGHTILGDENFISEDRETILFKATPVDSIDQTTEEFTYVAEALEQWRQANSDFNLNYLSDGSVNSEMFELINQDLDYSLIFSIPLTFLILLWVFGSIVAALIPLIIAIISLIMSLGVTAWFSHLLSPVSATAEQLVVLLVLAIGIDYSLFFVSRVREEVARGASWRSAIEIAGNSTTVSIFWSGLIVALSLIGLLLMQDTVLTSMALVAVISVLITVASAVLILPPIVLLLGDRIELGRLPKLPRVSKASQRVFNQLLSVSVRKPVLTLTLSLALLLGCACFVFFMRLGSTVEPAMFPSKMQSARAFEVLEKSFPDYAGSDFTIILSHPKIGDLEEEGELQGIVDTVLSNPSVRGPFLTEISSDRSLIRYQFVALGSANSESSKDLIHSFQRELFPAYQDSLGLSASLSGTLPYVVNESDRYRDRSPIVFVSVLLLSLVFLLLAFRSIVIPLKALILNSLSTAAAFGILVLLFQISEFGPWDYKVIESFIPPLLFAILFGLSMDYHVFILSRVSEEYHLSGNIRESVTIGLQKTARSITGAALIMVSVFLIIGSLTLPLMRELGLGLAVAIFLDATIVRCALLPASLILLGKWNWYLPKSLEWLPKVSVK